MQSFRTLKNTVESMPGDKNLFEDLIKHLTISRVTSLSGGGRKTGNKKKKRNTKISNKNIKKSRSKRKSSKKSKRKNSKKSKRKNSKDQNN